MPSEVQQAVQVQRASNADAIRRENIVKIIKRINEGMPKALAAMRENNFPIYRNRGFEESSERVNGKMMSVWKFKNSQAFQTFIRGTSRISVEKQGEDREFGIVFREGTNGRVTDIIIVGRLNQRDDFTPVDKNLLLSLRPYQVDAIRAVLDEMLKPPNVPVWHKKEIKKD